MLKLPTSLEKLINEFSKLPGIGPKSASRLTFYLLKKSDLDISFLADAVTNLKKDVVFCEICHNMSDNSPCSVCADISRDHSMICVVEEPLDAQALDATGVYKGVFHVLGGVLNPLEGIGPDKLNINSLIERIKNSPVLISEVILATNPSLEGETTSMHIQRLIQPLNIKTTRLARGLPIGGDLEYADEITITRAIQNRN
jgi:recombination protein RecR